MTSPIRTFRLTPRSKRTYNFVAEGGGGGDLALEARVAALEAQVASLIDDQEIVAGPTALAFATYLGVPLFRKVITINPGPGSSETNYPHGITNPVKFVGVTLRLANAGDHLCFTQGGMKLPPADPSEDIYVFVDNTDIIIRAPTGAYTGYTGEAILLYTLA